MKTCLLIAVASSLVGCPSQPPPAPMPPDATDAYAPIVDAYAPPSEASTACAAACAALAAASCPLGGTSDCPTFMARDIGSGKVANAATGKALTCIDIAQVKTKADAQKLGFVCN